ncbi:MAG: hypothetical protein K0S60_717 [Evtepia sp.]|jgi:hypothetical protein|nr:hypothetical protein [Evtepia sp.]
METVGILGGTERLRETLDGILPQCWRETMEILIAQAPRELDTRAPLELLAIFPKTSVGREEALPPCRLLLLPGTEAALISRCEASCAMSYGVSSKDSLTVSSLEADQVSIAVQRELVTITGGTVERQELILPVRGGLKPQPLLALVGLLLVLGVPPEQLTDLLEREMLAE